MKPGRPSLLALALVAGGCGGGLSQPSAAQLASAPSLAPPATLPAVIHSGVAIGQEGPAPLTLRYIERLPRLEYVLHGADPTVDGWPRPGSTVVWRAHLKNWSQAALADVDYEWRIDGATVSTGALAVGPLAEAALDLPWRWDRARHRVELAVDGAHRFTVPGGARHHLLVHSDALAVGFWVEQGFYDYFRQNQHRLRIGHSAFEDWAQFQIECFNLMLERAVFPETPQGVRDRLRLDAVHVVADGALPLDPAAYPIGGFGDAAQARPDVGDRTVDLQWGFPTRVVPLLYDNTSWLNVDNPSYYVGYVLHEIGHARYLIDVYNFDLFDAPAGTRIDIMEGGARLPGSRYMPGVNVEQNGQTQLRVHFTPYTGLMNKQWLNLDRYSAAAWNRIAGRRAVAGHYNWPENYGVFVNDLPRQNLVRVMDLSARPLAGALVRIYQAGAANIEGRYVGRWYDNAFDLELRADAAGVVALGRNPFTPEGRPLAKEGWDGVVVVRVEHEGRVGYGFLESSEFNLAFWRGEEDRAQYELRVPMLPPP